MAELHSYMLDFYEKVKLSKAKKDELKASRDAIRNDIKKYFKESKDNLIPFFHSQGSMEMGTTITPLNEEYDIDDGVYLRNTSIDLNNEDSWPSVNLVHELVANAANPNIRTIDKTKSTCVRIIYAKNYHVDLPIYITDFDNETFIPKLAHKAEGWIDSDPKGNTNYYKSIKSNYGEILGRTIVYLKSMFDYQSFCSKQKKVISGFELTLLACNAVASINIENNDEQVLLDIIDKIIDNCQKDIPLLKPVTNEDLWNKKNDLEKDKFIQALTYNRDILEVAILDTDIEIAKLACNDIWGDRFFKKNSLQLFPIESLSHRVKLEYKEEIKGSVNITATYSINGKPPLAYKNNLLPKGSSLRFTSNVINIAEPFTAKWQVTNTGGEATHRGVLRGDKFEDSNIGAKTRKETTEYRGSHIVQCFIIKDNICVAKSNEFIVNII